MSTDSVLTDEQIEDAAWDNRMENSRAEISETAFKYARAIEQAALQSEQVQGLRSALKEAITTLERDGDEWGICDRLRAALKEQP